MASPRRITEAQMRLVKPGLKLFTAFHVFLYKFTGGRLFNRIGGGEICIVKMTGAKSGQTREFPLMYVPYRNGIVLVASLAGAPSHPVWYHNLVKYPQFEVTVGSVVKKARRPNCEQRRKDGGLAFMLSGLPRFPAIPRPNGTRYPSIHLRAK